MLVACDFGKFSSPKMVDKLIVHLLQDNDGRKCVFSYCESFCTSTCWLKYHLTQDAMYHHFSENFDVFSTCRRWNQISNPTKMKTKTTMIQPQNNESPHPIIRKNTNKTQHTTTPKTTTIIHWKHIEHKPKHHLSCEQSFVSWKHQPHYVSHHKHQRNFTISHTTPTSTNQQNKSTEQSLTNTHKSTTKDHTSSNSNTHKQQNNTNNQTTSYHQNNKSHTKLITSNTKINCDNLHFKTNAWKMKNNHEQTIKSPHNKHINNITITQKNFENKCLTYI